MRRKLLAHGLLMVLLLVTCGCQSFTAEEAEVHDEIFSYELPFDKVYLEVTDVIDADPGWMLDETNQMKGLIMARSMGYEATQVTLVLKRIEKRHTTIELAKGSQKVRNVGALLKAIDTALISQ